jgi:hypothetical protein
MTKASTLISPIESQYTGHREADDRRRQTREWLRKREQELGFVRDAPLTAPEKTGSPD